MLVQSLVVVLGAAKTAPRHGDILVFAQAGSTKTFWLVN